jgi:hypothetical protein
MLARSFKPQLLPCWEASRCSIAETLVVSLRLLPSPPGAEIRRRCENDLTLRGYSPSRKRLAYHIEYKSHQASRCTLIRTH